MATPVVFNGVNYSVPAFGDVGYAQGPGNLSSYLIAIASGTLQQTGGNFFLTGQANFGPNFGLTAVNFTSTTTNPATAGTIRLAKTDTIDWRNNANGGNLPLGINVSDQLTYNGNIISSGGAGPVQSVSGTANQINSTGGANPVLSLSSTLIIPGTFTIPAVTNQIVLGTTNTITLTAPAPAASRTYTIPDVLGASDFLMTAGTQSVTGIKTFPINTNFVSNLRFVNAGGGANTQIISTSNVAATRTYTIPVTTADADFVLTESNQTINGTKTFADPIIQNDTTNQIVLGVTNTTTISAAAPAASRVVTIPDPGASASFVMTEGTQTINGIKTLATQGIIHGTSTNDSAAAGFVGEYIESVVGNANATTSTQYKDFTSISLTAGDWDVTGILVWTGNGATSVTDLELIVSSTSGNSTTGGVTGSNWVYTNGLTTGVTNNTNVVASYRTSLSGTTTYYLKGAATFATGTPQAAGRLSARRVR